MTKPQCIDVVRDNAASAPGAPVCFDSMSEATTTEVEVHRELMRLALHNSIRSIPLQIFAVVVMVLMGAAVGKYAGASFPDPTGSSPRPS
jgi:hypothetical protein